MGYWLDNYARTSLRAGTVYRYEGHLRRYVAPHLGHMELQRITPQHIQRLYTLLLDRGLSGQTVRHVHTILSKALGKAVDWGILSVNPVQRVTPPRVVKSEPATWTLEELARFRAHIAAHRLRPVFLAAICTGLRRSELVGAKQDALNLDAGFIRVTVGRQFVPGIGTVEDEPKTKRSRRSVEIGEEMVSVFRIEMGRRVLAGINSEYLFCDEAGQPLHPNTVSRDFHRACLETGVPPIRFQDLRHLHASLMLRSGEHLKAVSDRMGHSSIATTYDTYAHLMPDAGRASAAAVERQVFGT